MQWTPKFPNPWWGDGDNIYREYYFFRKAKNKVGFFLQSLILILLRDCNGKQFKITRTPSGLQSVIFSFLLIDPFDPNQSWDASRYHGYKALFLNLRKTGELVVATASVHWYNNWCNAEISHYRHLWFTHVALNWTCNCSRESVVYVKCIW